MLTNRYPDGPTSLSSLQMLVQGSMLGRLSRLCLRCGPVFTCELRWNCTLSAHSATHRVCSRRTGCKHIFAQSTHTYTHTCLHTSACICAVHTCTCTLYAPMHDRMGAGTFASTQEHMAICNRDFEEPSAPLGFKCLTCKNKENTDSCFSH